MRNIVILFIFIFALLITPAMAQTNFIIAAGLLEPTTTCNVTPVLKAFPNDKGCSVTGGTLIENAFQNLTLNPSKSENFTVGGETVTVSITVNSDKTFDFNVAGGAFWEYGNPAVAWGKPAPLIVYEADSATTHRHIYGRMWAPNAVYLPLVVRH